MGSRAARAGLALVVLAWRGPPPAAAQSALGRGGSASTTDAVVARVGGRAIFARDVYRVARHVGAGGLRRFGADWTRQRDRLLAEVLVPRELLAREADRTFPRTSLDDPTDRALALALRAELERETRRAGVSTQSLHAHLLERERHYVRPAGVLLWRILLPSERSARQLIDELGVPEEARFRRLARERSADLATNMRAGNLGYVAENGHTSHPQVRVDPALYAAAREVRDGELVGQPVAEGRHYAVIWRRASRPEERLPPARAEREARLLLLEAASLRSQRELIESLRGEWLSDYRPELVDEHQLRAREVHPSPRRSAAPETAERVHLAPRSGERGLR